MSKYTNDLNRAFRVRQVADFLGIGVSSVWRLAKNEPDFPKPFSLSPRTTAWSAEELAAYVEVKKSQRPGSMTSASPLETVWIAKKSAEVKS